MPYYIKKKKKEPLFDKGVKIKTKPNLVKKLDDVFSLYIRFRDALPNGYFKCISCGQTKPLAQADCGHYHSRKHMNTRFNSLNCNSECRACNRFSADHLIGYRTNLIRKIGQQAYDLLELNAGLTKKWTDFELEQLIKYYKALGDKLRKEKGL